MGMLIVLFAVFLLVGVTVMLQWISPALQEWFGWSIRFSLWNRNETYLSLFTLATVGAI